MNSDMDKLKTPRERKYYKKIFAAGLGGQTVYELYKSAKEQNPSLIHGSVQAVCRELLRKGVVVIEPCTDQSRMASSSERNGVNLYIAKAHIGVVA